MQTHELALPEATPTDPEVVATALETAGIFGEQGDVKEALRWIRRAAELAGDAGDDDRALSLARAASDLTVAVREYEESNPPPPDEPEEEAPAAFDPLATLLGPPPPPPPLPPPPPHNNAPARASSSPKLDSHKVAVSPIVSLESNRPQPVVSNARSSTSSPALPIPGAANVPRDLRPAIADEDADETTPAPPATTVARELSSPETVRRPAPKADELAKLFAEKASPAVAPEKPSLAAQRAKWTPEPSSKEVTAVRTVEPSLLSAIAEPAPAQAVVAEAEQTAPTLGNGASVELGPRATFHQTIRASVQASTELGVFILRVLPDGEAPAEGCYEALVVLTDPSSDIFAS